MNFIEWQYQQEWLAVALSEDDGDLFAADEAAVQQEWDNNPALQQEWAEIFGTP